MSDETTQQPPEITFTGGNPTDEEIAAVVAVIAARSAAQTQPEPEPRSGWAAYWRAVRAPLRPGPGSWRAAYRR